MPDKFVGDESEAQAINDLFEYNQLQSDIANGVEFEVVEESIATGENYNPEDWAEAEEA